jgi:hypothetical protein
MLCTLGAGVVDDLAAVQLRLVERDGQPVGELVLDVHVEGEGGEGRIEAEDDRVTLENPGEGRAGAEGAIGVFVALDEALGVPAPGQQRVGGAEAAANALGAAEDLGDQAHHRRAAADVHGLAAGQPLGRAHVLVGQGGHHQQARLADRGLEGLDQIGRLAAKPVVRQPGRMHDQRRAFGDPDLPKLPDELVGPVSPERSGQPALHGALECGLIHQQVPLNGRRRRCLRLPLAASWLFRPAFIFG